MDKSDFAGLFEKAVERALKEAGLPSLSPPVEFRGASIRHNPLTVEQALDALWLGDDRFYFIIDVGVLVGGEGLPMLFVRPSGHEPRAFSETWNPDDLGPFKSIGPLQRGQGKVR